MKNQGKIFSGASRQSGKTDNCLYEFNFARLMRRDMLAVVMEPGMRNPMEWKGLLGGTLGSDLYEDLSGLFEDGDGDPSPAAFEQALDRLHAQILRLLVAKATVP